MTSKGNGGSTWDFGAANPFAAADTPAAEVVRGGPALGDVGGGPVDPARRDWADGQAQTDPLP